MKMPYEKPMMAIERYELTQSIATCSLKIGFLNTECVINDPDAPLSMIDLAYSGYFIQDCENVAPDTGNDGLCYHTSVTMAFNS